MFAISEVHDELFKKVVEEKACEDLFLDAIGELKKQAFVIVIVHALVFVVFPFVFKEFGDLVLKLKADTFASVHLLHEVHEEGKLLTCAVSYVLVHGLELVKDVDEDAHHVREDGNAEQEDYRTQAALNVTARCEISKTNSGKTRK